MTTINKLSKYKLGEEQIGALYVCNICNKISKKYHMVHMLDYCRFPKDPDCYQTHRIVCSRKCYYAWLLG